MDKIEFGKKAEELAKNYLISKNYQFMFSNWRYKRSEIDLIFKKDNEFIFFEIKARKKYLEDGKLIIDGLLKSSQKKRIKIAALAFSKKYILCLDKIKFDLIVIELLTQKTATLRHYKNIF